MRKMRNKKGMTALCFVVPIVLALSFVPKIVSTYKRRKYTSTAF